jgi:RNA polymerase sigma factor for flagellar operon FliA
MLTKHVDKWIRYKKKNDRAARSELICEFVALVHYVFGRMSVYLPRILDDQDLVAAGMIGLISAVNDFDIERGVEFTTFAVPRIRGAMLDELREHDWVPRTARRRAAELDAAMNRSRKDPYSEADLGKVARLMGVARTDLGRIINKARVAAFVPIDHSHESDGHDSMSMRQLLADHRVADPGSEAEHADQCKALKRALLSLPEIERSVLTQYYFGRRMQKDIARDLRVSRSRVSQIHNHAVSTLRERLEAVGAA